jgi:membrane protein
VRGVVRATFTEQVTSFLLVLIGAALLLVALALIAIVQWLGAHLARLPWLGDIGWVIALPTALIIVTLTFAVLFRFLPPVRVAWRHIWIVAGACAIAWLIASEILTLYAIFFADRFGAWGAIGGLLMIMLWMNIVSQILFYGAEFCKVLSEPGWTVVEA